MRSWTFGLSLLAVCAIAARGDALDGPWATFGHQREATIRWGTEAPCPTVLEYASPDGEWVAVSDATRTRSHAITLTDLRRNTEYRYRLRIGEGAATSLSREYTLDTEFDFSVPDLPRAETPFPRDALTGLFERAAAEILKRSRIDRGYCLDYGCADGRLSYEIARQSRLQVAGFSTDREAVERGRQLLLAQGLYGSRVTLRYVPALDTLPLPDMCANLIVSGEALATGRVPGSAAEVAEKLQPCGGRAYLGGPRVGDSAPAEWLRAPVSVEGCEVRTVTAGGSRWAVLERAGPLAGAGEWTHAYGTAGQTANSNDELLRGEAGKTLEVQWFGLPGPNAMLDRQVRMQGPLSAAGRLFVAGWDRVLALDAYNGTILWSVEIPDFRRTNIPRDCGNACTDSEHLFLAVGERCWRLNAATGERQGTYPVTEGDEHLEWGYVAVQGDTLLGSGVRPGNMETGFAGPDKWFDETEGPNTRAVCSEVLFADRVGDGSRLWSHTGGLVINPTLAAGDGRVCFLESRSPEALGAKERRLGPELWGDAWLVALDIRTGARLWERPYRPAAQPVVVYVVYHADEVAVVVSCAGEYRVEAFSASTGAPLWQAQHPWLRDNHGHHLQHPVVAEGRLFLEPDVYDWRTGEKIDVAFPGRSKCGTITGAAHLLHYRDYNDEVWDLTTNTQSEFPGLRSNCWIGLISGNGLLLSPVSAGGCSCQWPIYTSIAYRAQERY